MFQYFSNKQKEEQHKTKEKNVLAILFEKKKHTGYFRKNIQSKHKFLHTKKSTLFLIVLSWLRQLKQLFYKQSKNIAARDRNE